MAKKNNTHKDENPFTEIVKTLENDYVSLVEDGLASDCDYFIDTGSYLFNALLSGSLFLGLPGNKITALAGEPATGKTYFVLEIIKNFLISNPTGYAFIFESEGALGKEMIVARGIDPKRVYVIPVATIEEFRTQAVRLLNGYLKTPEDKRPKMMIALDSLGMLSSNKETEDVEAGKDKRDLTKAALVKGTFRLLTLKCARAKVPIIFTNHIYDVIGAYIPTKEMCLVPGTLIQTENGLKTIESFEVGDNVKTLYGNKEILKNFTFDSEDIYEIEFEDGSIVRCTGEHKFLLGEENLDWVETKNLQVNDNVMTV